MSETVTHIPEAAPKAPRKKQMSERQLAANRSNATRSTGPTTPEGKARARFNALRHGFSAQNICLPGDDEQEYEVRREHYIAHYKPANIVEWDLVENLLSAWWRLARLRRFEKNLILDTVLRARIEMEQHYVSLSLDAETALALRELDDQSAALRLLQRSEARLVRSISFYTRLLAEAQNNRPPVEDGPTPIPKVAPEAEMEKVQNGPIPSSGHSGLAPIGCAIAPNTIEPKPRTEPVAVAAGRTLGALPYPHVPTGEPL